MTRLTLRAKDIDSELSSVLKVRAASPKVSNILEFHITRPATTSTPVEDISSAVTKVGLTIVATNDYESGGGSYIYDTELTVYVKLPEGRVFSSNTVRNRFYVGSLNQIVHISSPSWLFEWDDKEYNASDFPPWKDGGGLIDNEDIVTRFDDNTMVSSGFAPNALIQNAVWDAALTITVNLGGLNSPV